MLKHYRSLIPMAMEARSQPMAQIGTHVEATRNAYKDFLALARQIAARSGGDLSLTAGQAAK